MSDTMRSWMRTSTALLTISLILFAVTACVKSPEIVKHPDAPMLILGAKGKAVHVSVYDSQTDTLIEYGWIDAREVAGWTIVKYDWSRFLGPTPAPQPDDNGSSQAP